MKLSYIVKNEHKDRDKNPRPAPDSKFQHISDIAAVNKDLTNIRVIPRKRQLSVSPSHPT